MKFSLIESFLDDYRKAIEHRMDMEDENAKDGRFYSSLVEAAKAETKARQAIVLYVQGLILTLRPSPE